MAPGISSRGHRCSSRTVGYLPFLPDFLSGFAFLSLAILVSCGRVDGAQRRRSTWPQPAARAPSAQVDSPKFRRVVRPSTGLGVSTEMRLNGCGERREIDPETMRHLVEVLEASDRAARVDHRGAPRDRVSRRAEREVRRAKCPPAPAILSSVVRPPYGAIVACLMATRSA